MLPIETTPPSIGSIERETIVCSAPMICAETMIGSIPWCGNAPWLPLPVTTMSKNPTAAIIAPVRHRNVPVFAPGQLCSP